MSSSSGGSGGGGESAAYQNVQVVVRMRPQNEAERKDPSRATPCIRMDTVHGEVAIDNADMQKAAVPRAKRFTFDRVFDEKTTQSQLFDTAVSPVVDEVLRGYSCCIFAYGQTGTGKTHTMEGARREDGTFDSESDEAGIIPRAVRTVFQHLDAKSIAEPSFEYVVKMSFLEIYNEKLDDLLSPDASTFQENQGNLGGNMGLGGGHGSLFGTTGNTGAGGGGSSSTSGGLGGRGGISSSTMGRPLPGSSSLHSNTNNNNNDDDEKESGNNNNNNGKTLLGADRLKIISDDKFGQRVAGLEEITIKNPKDCFTFFHKGIAKRATAETKCNAASSRSHCVFTLTITMKELWNGQDMLRVGKLNLVDLAGAECVGRSGATERRAREAGNINQSLLTLGRVITALVEKSHHIPYRDSKLTRLLQDCLGGKTKTCIIATVGPAPSALEETLSTLEYANRAKNIKNRPEAHARVEKRDVVASAYMELERLRARFRQQIENQDGMISVKEDELNGMTSRIESLESQLKDLEAMKAAGDTEIKELRIVLDDTKILLEAARVKQAETDALLVQTNEKLEHTTAALGSEKVAHEETRVVLAATAQTESLLTTQAETMLHSLRETVSDVEGLHGKVERSSTVLASNRKAGDVFASQAATRLSMLATTAASFQASTSKLMNGMKNDMSVFLNGRAEDASTTAAAIQRVRNNVASYARNTSTSAASTNDEISKLTSEGTTLSESQKQKSFSTADESIQQAIAASLQSIQMQVEAQAAALQAWTEASTKSFEQVNTTIARFAESQVRGLEAISATLQTGAAEIDATLTAQDKCIAQFKATQQESTRTAADAILSQFTVLMNSFVNNTTESMNKATASLHEQTVAAKKVNKSVKTNALASVSGVSNAVTTWASATSGQVQRGKEDVVSRYSASEKITATTTAFVADANASVEAATTSVKTVAEATATSTIAVFEAASKLSAAYASKTKSAAVSAGEMVTKDCDGVATCVTNGDTRTRAYVGTVDVAANAAMKNTDVYASHVRTWVADEGAALHSFFTSDLVEDYPTGKTPAKKEYTAPSSFVATSPADAIIARYRAARNEGASTPVRHARAYGGSSSGGSSSNGSGGAALPSMIPLSSLIMTTAAVKDGRSASPSKIPTPTKTLAHTSSAAALLALNKYRSSTGSTTSSGRSSRLSGASTSSSRLSIESVKSTSNVATTSPTDAKNAEVVVVVATTLQSDEDFNRHIDIPSDATASASEDIYSVPSSSSSSSGKISNKRDEIVVSPSSSMPMMNVTPMPDMMMPSVAPPTTLATTASVSSVPPPVAPPTASKSRSTASRTAAAGASKQQQVAPTLTAVVAIAAAATTTPSVVVVTPIAATVEENTTPTPIPVSTATKKVSSSSSAPTASTTTATTGSSATASAANGSLATRIATAKPNASTMKSTTASSSSSGDKIAAPSPGRVAARAAATTAAPEKTATTAAASENKAPVTTTSTAVAPRESRLHRPSTATSSLGSTASSATLSAALGASTVSNTSTTTATTVASKAAVTTSSRSRTTAVAAPTAPASGKE